MLNDLKLSLQYILPKLWLTRLAGWGASKRAGWLTKLVIDLFVKYYKVDMKEAQKPDTAAYRTFNDFFVRPLRDDVRPLNTDPNVLVMPADGVISQLGAIEDDKILQAKGHDYSLEACWPATIRWPTCSVTAASPPPICRRATITRAHAVQRHPARNDLRSWRPVLR